MSKYNFVIMVSVVLLIFYSCGLPYCKKTHLTDDELAWVSHININDTFYLYGENIVDTLVFTDKQIHNKRLISIFDLKACNWMEGNNEYNANASCDFYIKHKGEIYDGYFQIIKYVRKSPSLITFCFCLAGFFSETEAQNQSDISLVFEKNVNAEETYAAKTMGVKKIMWTKNNGIKSIELDDGTKLIAIRK